MKKGRQRSLVLDCLRVLAVVEILLMHLTLFLPAVKGDRVFAFMSKISSRGANGVAVLFVLSGYLIFRELKDGEAGLKEQSRDKSSYFRSRKGMAYYYTAPKGYYAKRIRRLVPAYFLVLALYVAVGLLPLDANILRYFLFVNGFVPSHDYQLYNNMGAFWTMGCFMLWYLAAPLYVRWVKGLRAALCVSAATFVFGYAVKAALRFAYVYVGADEIDYMLGNNPFGNLYFFCFGMIAYFLLREGREKEGILASATVVTLLSVINSPWYLFWAALTVIFILVPMPPCAAAQVGMKEAGQEGFGARTRQNMPHGTCADCAAGGGALFQGSSSMLAAMPPQSGADGSGTGAAASTRDDANIRQNMPCGACMERPVDAPFGLGARQTSAGLIGVSLPGLVAGRLVTFLSNISFDIYLVHLGVITLLAGRSGVLEDYGSLWFVIAALALVFFCAVALYYVDKLVLQRVLRIFMLREGKGG